MRYRMHQGQLVPSHTIPHGPSLRSHLSAPMIIRDDMEALINHANGQRYDSKSEFRKATRAGGFEEVGNDAPTTGKAPEYDPGPGVEGDIKQAMEQLGL